MPDKDKLEVLFAQLWALRDAEKADPLLLHPHYSTEYDVDAEPKDRFAKWLEQLTPHTREKAETMHAILTELGDEIAESTVHSEIEEGIPQLTRFILLRHLWREVIDHWREDPEYWLGEQIKEAPDGHFGDAGAAIQHLMELGATPGELANIARFVAATTVFSMLYQIDVDDESLSDNAPGWSLVETDGEGRLTRRRLQGLYESLLTADPSGREGKPE